LREDSLKIFLIKYQLLRKGSLRRRRVYSYRAGPAVSEELYLIMPINEDIDQVYTPDIDETSIPRFAKGHVIRWMQLNAMS
jgi:hypothetical protein